MSVPWDTGDYERNWSGYFIPGTRVLRNLVGAKTSEDLLDAENDLVETRTVELREDVAMLGPRTFDLSYLLRVHAYLFQDVYDWAGELRTVGIQKGGESFCPPGSIARPMEHVADEIGRTDALTVVSLADVPRVVAYLYDYVNFAHPFREGNGRATREFFEILLSVRGYGIAWEQTDVDELHGACHRARAEGDLGPLIAMFTRILDSAPAYDI